MRFVSGVTDQYIYFVAVDATDLITRETGLSSFTVRRSRNGGASAAYTTPTINETDSSNMPGVYELLLSEDMTLDSGDHSQMVALHITHAGMAPVTLQFEIYRTDVTAGETLTVASGIGNAAVQSIANNAITAASINADAITDAKVASDVTIASVTGAVGSVTGNVGGNVTGSVGSVATGGITATSIAADAIGASELATDAVTEIVNAVWAAAARTLTALDEDNTTLDLDATIRAAIGMASANLDTQLTTIDDFLDTEIAAIKAKTDNLPSDPADASDIASAFTTVNTKLDTIDDFLDTEVAAIKAKTDNLPSDPADASDISAAFGTVNSTLATIATYVDTEVAAIKAKTDNLPSDPADASEIAGLIAAVEAKIDTVDSVVDAVKAKTDSLTFSVVGQVDANIQYVNNVQVTGDGQTGTEWGPA